MQTNTIAEHAMHGLKSKGSVTECLASVPTSAFMTVSRPVVAEDAQAECGQCPGLDVVPLHQGMQALQPSHHGCFLL